MDIRGILVLVSGRYSPNDSESLYVPTTAAGMKPAGQFEARSSMPKRPIMETVLWLSDRSRFNAIRNTRPALSMRK